MLNIQSMILVVMTKRHEETSCDDIFMIFVVIFGLAENMTAYEDGDLDASSAADNIVELMYLMVGFYRR